MSAPTSTGKGPPPEEKAAFDAWLEEYGQALEDALAEHYGVDRGPKLPDRHKELLTRIGRGRKRGRTP
jgi:hypothetical protein